MSDKPHFLNVEWQGFPCSPVFSITRSAGFSPDLCIINVHRSDIGKLEIADPPGGFESAILASAIDNVPGKDRVLPVGELRLEWLSDTDDGATDGTHVVFKHMLLSEQSLEVVAATEGDQSGLLQIQLTDLRELWKTKGFVWKWVNVPLRALPASGDSGGGTQEASSPFLPGSQDPGTQEVRKGWTLRRCLEAVILPALPGKPSLKSLSKSLENYVIADHRWDGELALNCFREVLSEVDAIPVLNPDCSVSVWKRGDGPLQDSSGKVIDLTSDSVASSRLLMSHRISVPDTVVVVGRPIVETITVQLQEAGATFLQGLSKIVPLAQAFRGAGIPDEVASKITILEHSKRMASGLSDDAALAIERWGHKWYALPSAMQGLKTQLPIEDCAECDETGQRLPPIVRSEGVRPIKIQLLRNPDANKNASLLRVDPSNNIVMQNIDLALQNPNDGSYEIDRENGLVAFAAPRVKLIKDGVGINDAEVTAAKVTLTFGVTRKPTPDSQLKITDRYASAWQFKGTRERESEDLTLINPELNAQNNIAQVDASKVDLSTAVVIQTDIQMLRSLDGRTNQAFCDSLALVLAAPKILANRFIAGGVVDLLGIADVIPTGRILTVTWASESGAARTVAHDGMPAPLRAAPRPISTADLKDKIRAVSVGVGNTVFLPGRGR